MKGEVYIWSDRGKLWASFLVQLTGVATNKLLTS